MLAWAFAALGAAGAEEAAGPARAEPETVYQIPQTVFVGDSGTLAARFGASAAFPPGAEALAVVNLAEVNAELGDSAAVRNAFFERGQDAPLLLVEFTAYRSGRLRLPPLEFAGEGGRFLLDGLAVEIASILTPFNKDLSPLAPPLAAPGTSLLIYGLIALLALVCAPFFTLAFARNALAALRARLRRRSLLRAMRSRIRRLTGALAGAESGAPNALAAEFTREFRAFLSRFTTLDCRAVSAGELLALEAEPLALFGFPVPDAEPDAVPAPPEPLPDALSTAFLGALLRRCDVLRFGGNAADRVGLAVLLDDALQFIGVLEAEEKRRNRGIRRLLRKKSAERGGAA